MNKVFVLFALFITSSLLSAYMAFKINHEANDKIFNLLKNRSTKEIFKAFHFLYQKEYDINTEVALKKYKIFKQNLKGLRKLEQDASVTWKVGINEYFDEEVFDDESKQSSKFENELGVQSAPRSENSHKVFESVDWRSKLTSVLGYKSGCYSNSHLVFAALIDFSLGITSDEDRTSPQSMIDCNESDNCNRFMWYEKSYRIRPHLFSVKDYPYTGTPGTCNQQNLPIDKRRRQGHIWQTTYSSSSSNIIPSIESTINALKTGPLLTLCEFWPSSYYKEGIFRPTNSYASCGSSYFTTLVVGYGVENGQQYWIVRGFRGPSWGENGYMKIARDDTNNSWGATCNYATVYKK